MTIVESQLEDVFASLGPSMIIFDGQFVVVMSLRGPSMAGSQFRVITTPFETKCGDL